MNRRFLGFTLVILSMTLIWSVPVSASPWTLPADELVLGISQDFQYADREFLPDGTHQSFPLNASYRTQNSRIGARYGFTDRFEGAMDLNFSMVNYEADTLILDDFAAGTSAGDATRSIRDFNSSQFGAGDFRFHGRYQLVEGAVMIASETTLKLPTGYESPTGTFVTNADGEQEIGGQATLGDGQTDLTQSILLGTFIPQTNTFVRIDAGFRFRFGDPGHQGHGFLRAGQFIGNSLVLLGGIGGVKTLTEGEIIGQTFVAVDPEVEADEYTADNIEAIDLRLDRDALVVEAGFIVSVGEVEFVTNYSYTMLGANTAALHSVSVGTIFAFSDITGK